MEDKAALYMYDVLSALSYCHKAGVIHRDIKPENLVFAHKGEDAPLKVIDFGISLLKCKKLVNETPIGTIYYAAPEVFSGEFNEKCDVWSCGIILYMLLSYRLPFNKNDDVKTMKAIINEPLQFKPASKWRHVSAEARDLIKRMLEKDYT